MAEALIDYSNSEPDWWDAAGATGEAIKTEIGRLVDNTFGPGGLDAIKKAAIQQAAFKQYEAQQAIKAAGATAVRAAGYADMPGSTLFKDAVASGIAYENIAKNLTTDAGQIMKNAAVDGAYVFNKGDGADTINEYDPTAGNVDIAQFSNVASTAVRSIERKGGDLVIGYGTTDQFTVSNYFNGAA